MEAHERTSLETRITALAQSFASVADPKDFTALLQLIHRPGWTTPAESLLVQGIIEAMDGHIQVLTRLKQALMEGAGKVELTP